ncbi:dnaJ homolog subfamily C member 17 [Centruroides vittatus]|uniref:dnaJ homolog subfamily C member 17 n=1 Tax=Centruroides vittatus TaxID=120091 RepID=UPI00350F0C1F
MADITNLDLYKLLGIDLTATEKEIKSAYRKKALSCHPDKNPDNPKAAELFQQLSKALEILTDSSARAAYDNVIRAKKATEERNKQLDSKRKKFKDDLEEREKAALTSKLNDISAAEKLRAEIERLRKEGSKQLEEEREKLRKEIEKECSLRKSNEAELPRIKVKWKSKKSDENNGGYNYENMVEIFGKYGDVTCVMSSKKGSALLEFSNAQEALNAFENEKGLEENPVTLTWIQGKPKETDGTPTETETKTSDDGQSGNGVLSDRDYESLVLMKLRRAEERKRLIQELMKEND